MYKMKMNTVGEYAFPIFLYFELGPDAMIAFRGYSRRL
jgi:hypothetical protein